MEVPVSTLRAELKAWITRAREGEPIIITDRGVPIAKLMSVRGADLLEQLEREGLVSAPGAPRPAAPDRKGAVAPGASGVAGLVRRLRR
jgi:prevent-host-death family protein